ncbi:hypothetical protein FA13DRAFT_1791804 [Coprinellus micaceus]|uniref:Uncharacterized protein n=1 Tax=Coprinellus micaceus TaxID=71717 RepID=A0A4Y7TA91_COPMI|nr:hypothetical protein FA13DRAFT_1791804 [Coprinellus micaceus]
MGVLVLDEGFSAIYDRVVLNARNPKPPSSDGLRMARVQDVEIPVSFIPLCGDGLDSSVFQKAAVQDVDFVIQPQTRAFCIMWSPVSSIVFFDNKTAVLPLNWTSCLLFFVSFVFSAWTRSPPVSVLPSPATALNNWGSDNALWLAHFSPEVVEQIVEWLPVWVLKILTHSPTYASMARRVLNNRVAGFLQLWGLHPDETLTLMRHHHAILSGQAALTTVEPAPWFPDNLDCYCPITTCDEVVDWFICHGYVVEDDRAPVIDLEFGNGIARADLESPDKMTVLAFDFPIVWTGISKGICQSVSLRQPASGKCIRVNESYSDNAAVPVCFFLSTLDMNFITGNGVVSLYPQLTSKRRGLLNMQLNPPLFPVERETIASLT